MRIRELVLQHFRVFREQTRLSFLDPETGRVRPVTAIVGADEVAKATVLEAIEALLSYAVDPRHPKPLIHEALAGGLVRLELELTADDLRQFYGHPLPPDLPASRVLRIEVGRQGIAPLLPVREWSRFLACLAPRHAAEESFTNAGALSTQLLTAVARMHRGADLHGGLLYFPSPQHAAGARGKGDRGASDRDPAHAPARAGDERRRGAPSQDRAWIVRAPGIPLAAGDGVPQVGWPGQEAPDIPSRPAFEDTQAIPLFGELDRRRRPGAVIAVETPAIPLQPPRQRRAIERLRRLAHDWDAQLIMAVDSDEVLEAFPPEERVLLTQPSD